MTNNLRFVSIIAQVGKKPVGDTFAIFIRLLELSETSHPLR